MIRNFWFAAAFFVIGCTAMAADVSAASSQFGFSVKGSSLTVFVTDGCEGGYELSMDGGESFFKVKMPFTFPDLPNGTYQLRVKYGSGELSEVKTAVRGKSGIPSGNEIYLAVAEIGRAHV